MEKCEWCGSTNQLGRMIGHRAGEPEDRLMYGCAECFKKYDVRETDFVGNDLYDRFIQSEMKQ